MTPPTRPPVPPAPTGSDVAEDGLDSRAALIGGAVFLASGAALVVHILTDAPLGAVLGLLVGAGAVTVAVVVWRQRQQRQAWLAMVRVGVFAGALSTVAYDVSRWLLVEVAGFHTSPFKALPFFGEALLGSAGGPMGTAAAGVAFHALNGVAFGTAYTVWFGGRRLRWGVGFALGLEAFMLALYPGWLDVRSLQELTQISLLGHVVYGLVLAATARALMGRNGRREREVG